MIGPVAKARLDADRTARPLTSIVVDAAPGQKVGIWARYAPGQVRVVSHACAAHSDCRETPALGAACYASAPAVAK